MKWYYEYISGMNVGLAAFLTAFGLALTIGTLIFILGRRGTAKPSPLHNGGTAKFIPYSCGEYLLHDISSGINLERFMVYSLYFLIFDVAAFILAISFNTLALAVIMYALVLLSSILLVVKR